MARAFNRVFGFLVGLGFGLPHNYLLEVRGRKSGRGRRFLVAARGRTQWVRNVEATGEVTLKKGRTRQRFRLRPVPDKEKPELLKAYLDRFKLTAQRYFPVPAGSDPQAFVDVAAHTCVRADSVRQPTLSRWFSGAQSAGVYVRNGRRGAV